MLLDLRIWEVAEIVPVVSFGLLFEGISSLKTFLGIFHEDTNKNYHCTCLDEFFANVSTLKSYLLFISIVEMPGRSTDKAKWHSVKNRINSDLK